ncbi:hypothetical protein RJ639_044693 [Escallonia herrerae]|uniref:Bromo domain-containing protein n=1 Tax=Escallonia herrerae TaxID=1293975 RepID=A0AA89B0H9_9ASTE|nr:hypothetical protein RJ639_044693 [Escallonia herrerae]
MKDIYGVYAEPVDPEELPDYHEVIKHPMDFPQLETTWQVEDTQLWHNWSLAEIEYFCPVLGLLRKSDVFLICSNPMQYNVPDTVYYKQASFVQEPARRKFQKLRIVVERSGKELESEHKTGSNSLAKKLLKKPISQTVQELVGSDFSSGATLATAGDFQNGPIAVKAGGNERPANAHLLDLLFHLIVPKNDQLEEMDEAININEGMEEP